VSWKFNPPFSHSIREIRRSVFETAQILPGGLDIFLPQPGRSMTRFSGFTKGRLQAQFRARVAMANVN